jgi:hypothetical protein
VAPDPGYGGAYPAPPGGYYPPPPDYGTAPAYPQDPRAPGPGARRHEGFFLRLGAGVGASGTRYHEAFAGARRDVKTRGLSGLFELGIGGSVAGNLILHANMVYSSVGDGRREVSGVRDASYDVDTGMGLLGGGVTYYFMPANVYLTGVAGVAGIAESRDGRNAIESRAGAGGVLSLGKEWWVGRPGEWGMGAALRGGFYTAKADVFGDLERLYAAELGVNFSATLN